MRRPNFRWALAVGVAGALLPGGIASAGLNRWTTNGPYGGSITALVADSTRAGTAYAAINGYGVFRTVDRGASWVAVNQGLTGVGLVPFTIPFTTAALAIDPIVTSTLYVALSQGGLFKSVDSGATWQETGGFGAAGCVAVDPQTPSTIYACAGAGVERSADRGATWQAAATGMPANAYVVEVVIDPAQPSLLYAVLNTTDHRLYKSTDGGTTWTPLPNPPANNGSLAVDASSRVFATTALGVFRSTDAGVTWVEVLAGYGFDPASVVGGDLYVAGTTDPNSEVFPGVALRSTDGGDHWSPLAAPVVPTIFAGSPAEPETVYAGSTAGIFVTVDDGAHWNDASSGIQAIGAQLSMDPANPALVYAASYPGGLFSSRDGGRSWTLVSTAFIGGVAIQPGTLALFSTLGRSDDGGVTWQPTSMPSYAAVPVIVARAPQFFFAGIAECAGLTGGYAAQIFESADGGTTWNVAYDAQLGGCTSPVVSASGRTIFSGVEGFAIRTVVRSRDGGATWSGVDDSGWPDDWYLSDYSILAIDPSNENVVYSLVEGKLWRSLVGGGQWQEIDAGIPPSAVPYLPIVSNLVVDPVSPTTLYASTPEGVYRSLDRGTSWNALSDGLPSGPTSGLVIDSTGRILHVAAGGGVYDIEIGGGCVATNGTLCLLGGRFVVTAQAIDPRTGRLEDGTALDQTDNWGYFSLPGFTGDPSFPEIVVKMADARSIGDGFWFFHSGLTDLEYTLSVLDTVTGQQKSYQNDRSDPKALCGAADTGTFTGAASASGNRIAARTGAGPGSSVTLLGRFSATLSAIDPRTGNEADGVPIARDSKWGYFSIPAFTGDPTFPEVFVKMLDGTALGGYFWVFHTGLTDLEYTLTVTDSTNGAQRVYHNERNDPSRLCGGADTAAFHE